MHGPLNIKLATKLLSNLVSSSNMGTGPYLNMSVTHNPILRTFSVKLVLELRLFTLTAEVC
jgi:hypothetical protein